MAFSRNNQGETGMARNVSIAISVILKSEAGEKAAENAIERILKQMGYNKSTNIDSIPKSPYNQINGGAVDGRPNSAITTDGREHNIESSQPNNSRGVGAGRIARKNRSVSAGVVRLGSDRILSFVYRQILQRHQLARCLCFFV
jgi:hypothetical protein